MKRSEWIAVGSIAAGLFASTIGSALYLSFKIGGVNERVIGLEKNQEKFEKNMDHMGNDINDMKNDISDIKVSIAEMKIKVDVLWHDHVVKSQSQIKK